MVNIIPISQKKWLLYWYYMPAIIDIQKLSRIKYIVMVFHCRVVKILYVDNFLLGGDKCGLYHSLINLKFISKINVMHFRHNSEISVNVNGIPIANYFVRRYCIFLSVARIFLSKVLKFCQVTIWVYLIYILVSDSNIVFIMYDNVKCIQIL